MRKILITSVLFFGCSGCASVLGVADYGDTLNKKDVLNYLYYTTSNKEYYTLELAKTIYESYQFERDTFNGLEAEGVQRILASELVKYFEKQTPLSLTKKTDNGIGYTRHIRPRTYFNAKSYDPQKKVFPLTLSHSYVIPELKFKYKETKPLTSTWPLRTIITQENLYDVVRVHLDLKANQYDWSVDPDSAVKYLFKGQNPQTNIERTKKVVQFAGDSPYIVKYYDKVDLIHQVEAMTCYVSVRTLFQKSLPINCIVDNNIVDGYLASDI